MTGKTLRSRRNPAGHGGRARRALVPLLTGLAAVSTSLALAGPAGASPHPARARIAAATLLNSVSCLGAGACFAVGAHTRQTGPAVTAIDRLSGTTWSAVPSPSPAGAQGAFLNGVSCASTRACLAVGYYGTPRGKYFALAARWNGTRWSRLSVPAAGSTTTVLNGVTCLSAGDCWAIGGDSHGSLAEHWNGAAWSIFGVPAHRGTRMTRVSCAAAGNCWAVGSWSNSSGQRYGTVTARWDGKTWSAVHTPTSAASASQLNGASCAPDGQCIAVGNEAGQGLAQLWDGTAWSRTRVPPVAKALTLLGDTCDGGPACLAVGTRVTGPTAEVDYAAAWNGTKWSALAVPSPAHWLISILNSVTCPAPGSCWAVGVSLSPGAPGRDLRIIAHWNGTVWTLVH